MDGAKYHIRKENPKPTSQWKVADIRSWYEKNGIRMPDGENGKPATKAALLEHAKTIQQEDRVASYEIAKRYLHVVQKTPPTIASSSRLRAAGG